MKRATTGSVDDLHNGTWLNCDSNNCTYGIYYDYQVFILPTVPFAHCDRYVNGSFKYPMPVKRELLINQFGLMGDFF